MVSFIFKFETINVAIPEPRIIVSIHASAAEAGVVNLNVIRKLLVDGVSAFFFKGKSVFIMVQETYQEIYLILLF